MSEVVQMTIENVLRTEKMITYKVVGKSMEPMIIPNKDLVTIRAKDSDESFSENDVVLYRQKGKLTLHRVVSVQAGGEYVLLGDNCSVREYGVKESDILGVLISFKHNGSHYDVLDPRYLKYVHEIRAKERNRIVRKRVYDIIVQHLGFLPNGLKIRVKTLLKKLIVYKIDFN